MAEDTQNPSTPGIEWDAAPPAAVQTGTPAPTVASPSADSGIEWDTDAHVNPAPDEDDQGFLHGVYTHGVQPLVDTAKLIGYTATHPSDIKPLVDAATGAVQSHINTYKQGADELQSARDGSGGGFLPRAVLAEQGIGHVIASAVPFIGPQITQTGNDIQTKPDQGAGEVVGDLATTLLPHFTKGIKAKVEAPIDPAGTTSRRALAGLIAKAPGMGDNFEPEAVSGAVEPLIQQAAKDDPTTAKTALNSTDPKESYKAFQKLVNHAQTSIDIAHRQVLAKVSNAPVSVRPILEAMDASMPHGLEKFAPEDAAAIKALRANIANAKTLGDLNGLRVYLNTELSPEFKMDNVAVGRTAALDKAMRSALSATKDTYYDNLQHVTGQDFRTLKQAESNLMTYQEALANSRRGQFAAEAEFNRPTTGKQKLAKAGEIVGAVVQGNKAKLAQGALRESPMAQSHANIKQVLKAVPKDTTGFSTEPPPAAPQQRQLPSSTIGDGDGENVYQHEKAGPVSPAVVTPFYERPLLPETAGQGLALEPAVAHPGVNEPTATTRVRQPIFKKPETPSNGTVVVTPSGDAIIQRKQLPAPEEHLKLPAPKPKVKGKAAKKILSGG